MSSNLKINHLILACRIAGIPNIENLQIGGKEQKKLTINVTFFHSDNENSLSEISIVVWNRNADLVQQCSEGQTIFCAGALKMSDRQPLLLVKNLTI
jgi:hypothetical protein